MRPDQRDWPDEPPPGSPRSRPPRPPERPPPQGHHQPPPPQPQGPPPGPPGGQPGSGGYQQGPPPQQGSPPARGSGPQGQPPNEAAGPSAAAAPPAGTAAPHGEGPQRGQSRPPAGTDVRKRAVLEPVSVGDVARRDVVTAERDTPIESVVTTMAREGVGSVVIVEDDAPIGLLTDREIALNLSETPDLAERPADYLVGNDLLTGSTDMSVLEALNRMGDAGVRRLPIVDDEGRLEGIVTIDDVLVMLGEEFADVTRVVQQQSLRP